MSIRIRHVLALTAVAAVALIGTGPATAAPAPSTTTDPAAAAAGWLAQQFVGRTGKPAPNGDHFNFPPTPGFPPAYWGGLTASGIFALAAVKAGADKIDAAIGYMATHVAGDAGLGSGTQPGPFDGSVATAALAAIVAGRNPTALGGQNLLQALKDDECTSVTMPADQNDFTTPTCPVVGAARNIFSSVSESLAILAAARGAAQYGVKYAPSGAAVKYFLSLQCPGGGFTGHTSACSKASDASADETAYASMALAALGGHAAQLDEANHWLRAQRNPAGYWVAQGGPDVDSTGLAVAALAGSGADVSTSRAWLASQQVSDGPTVGTGATRGALKFQGTFDPSSSIKATADGVLGLARSGSLATLTADGASAATPVFALAAPRAKSPTVRAGGTQTVTGPGFAAGEQVSGVLHSAPVAIGAAKASKSGTATLTFMVPATLAPGAHTVVLTGATSGLSATSATFRVTAAPVAGGPSTSPSTPPTGSEPPLAATGLDGRQALVEALIGAGLVLAGAGAVCAGRRRRA